MVVAAAVVEEGSALAKMVPVLAVEDSAAGAAAAGAGAAGAGAAGTAVEPRRQSLDEYKLECLRLDAEEEARLGALGVALTFGEQETMPHE